MPTHDRQPDLFAEPKPTPAHVQNLRPPYTWAELEELDRTMRGFERIPDAWCADWWEIYNRAHDTLRQIPREQRDAYRSLFFAQADRLLKVEWAEEAAQKAAAAPAAKPRRRTRAARAAEGDPAT
jgi:hypothetical protein